MAKWPPFEINKAKKEKISPKPILIKRSKMKRTNPSGPQMKIKIIKGKQHSSQKN